MKIVETFLSIQGEGPHAGMPCFFIRTAGCNLSCDWCDTEYARSPQGRETSVDELVAAYLESASGVPTGPAGFPGLLACVTGGEPLLQPDVPALLERLSACGAPVDLMTNGTLPLGNLPDNVCAVIDLKVDVLKGRVGPEMELAARYHFAGAATCSRPDFRDCVKFVVRDRDEFNFVVEWTRANGVISKTRNIIVSPAWGKLDPAELADWILDRAAGFRLGLQLHKIIWGPDTRL